jgi:hypothetical protein
MVQTIQREHKAQAVAVVVMQQLLGLTLRRGQMVALAAMEVLAQAGVVVALLVLLQRQALLLLVGLAVMVVTAK